MSVIEVAIGPGDMPGIFRVEVVDSPAGQAYAAVQLDVDSLLARRGMLQQSVLASAVSSRRVLPETEQPVNEIGQELFAALLGTGEVAGLYRASAAMAKDCDQELRVVLRIDTPASGGAALGGDVRPGRRGVRVPAAPGGPPRAGRVGPRAAAASARRYGSWAWSPPRGACPPWTWRRSSDSWPVRWPGPPARASSRCTGRRSHLGRSARPAARRAMARAALHRARGLRPRPGRGDACAGT